MTFSLVHAVSRSPVALLLVLALTGACREGTPPDETATFTGRLAGAAWAGEASALLRQAEGDAPDILYVWGSRPVGRRGWPDESIAIRIPIDGTGLYELGPEDVSLTVLTGGDVVTRWYVGVAGTVEITDWGGSGGVVEGVAAFELQLAGDFAPHGQRAAFTNGWFRAVVVPAP